VLRYRNPAGNGCRTRRQGGARCDPLTRGNCRVVHCEARDAPTAALHGKGPRVGAKAYVFAIIGARPAAISREDISAGQGTRYGDPRHGPWLTRPGRRSRRWFAGLRAMTDEPAYQNPIYEDAKRTIPWRGHCPGCCRKQPAMRIASRCRHGSCP
jgi:hypothetical protein